MIYVMNSAVMPAGCFGTYQYLPASVDDLAAVLKGEYGPWQSTLGYPQNLDLVHKWTGIRPPLNRVNNKFLVGDSAIVMRLKRRVANPKTKGAQVSESPDDWEFAWVHFIL